MIMQKAMLAGQVFYAPGVALLDAITVRYGSTERLGRFFLDADYRARQMGVTLRLHNNFVDLLEVNAANRESWTPLAPTFDPRECDLPQATSFWLSAQSAEGEVVATCAARLAVAAEGGLADEFTSLRFFFSRPDRHVAQGVRCEVSDSALDACRHMTGRLSYTGAQWTHPAFRGRGIVHLLSKVNRLLAMTQWNTDYTAAVTKADLAAKGVIQPYDYSSDRLVSLFNYEADRIDMSVIWTTRTRMEADLLDYVSATRRTADLVTDADDMANSLLANQGSRRRS